MVVRYFETLCRSALVRSKLGGLDYALNPYVGCEHGCLYCYARHTLRDEALAREWGRVVFVKRNLLEVLRGEVVRKRRGVVGVSTVTDPYQPVERAELLTRRGVDLLSRYGFRVSIQTKSGLVLRDLDIIAGRRELFDVGLTIITMDGWLSSRLEPGAPPPRERARVLEKLSSEGVETWIFLGPVIPGLNDTNYHWAEIVELAAATGSRIYYDKLNLRPYVREALQPFLERYSPGSLRILGSRVEEGRWVKRTFKMLRRLCEKVGVECISALKEP